MTSLLSGGQFTGVSRTMPLPLVAAPNRTPRLRHGTKVATMPVPEPVPAERLLPYLRRPRRTIWI